MSTKYENVRRYYETGAWKIDRVRAAVGKWITQEEYREITGEEYHV